MLAMYLYSVKHNAPWKSETEIVLKIGVSHKHQHFLKTPFKLKNYFWISIRNFFYNWITTDPDEPIQSYFSCNYSPVIISFTESYGFHLFVVCLLYMLYFLFVDTGKYLVHILMLSLLWINKFTTFAGDKEWSCEKEMPNSKELSWHS